MTTTPEVLVTAQSHHQAGRLQDAAEGYRAVLTNDPNQPVVWYLLGLVACQTGQPNVGATCFSNALVLAPEFVEAHDKLGTVCFQEGKLDEAIGHYQRALALNPAQVETLNNLGNAFSQRGDREDAIRCYRCALEVRPDFAEAHNNLGNALFGEGKFPAAESAYRQSLLLNSDQINSWQGLGNVISAQGGRDHEATECYRRVLERNPHSADALINLAASLSVLGNWMEIESLCRRAIAIGPEYSVAHLNLASALQRQGRLDEALACCNRALELDQSSALAHQTRGAILVGLARLEEAVASYRTAITLQPNFLLAHSSLLYSLYFCPDHDSAKIYEEHLRWNETHAAPHLMQSWLHRNEVLPECRLRIGYVSPYYQEHCQAFFTVPLLSNHDHHRFEIFCYSYTARPDSLTERLRSWTDQWRDVRGQSDEQIATLVREDKIDILVDLTMHMANGRPLIFARKPAPVQLCWLAYPGTTGLTSIDYRFTDPYLDPPGMLDRYYSEESIRLPHTFWCYDPLTGEPGVNGLPAREKGYVTFGCLNNFCKVNEGMLRLWAGVMRVVERSRLVLMTPEGSARERVLGILGEEGIAAERVAFVPYQPRARYLATYHQIDIGLETLPYNGHTTSLDSFWMGVPVPTIVGQTVVGRAGVCLLENLGLRELIAETPEEYVRVVSELAGNLERLAELRVGLRGRMERSPLMDGPGFARDMEAAYRMIWRRWCEKGQGIGSRK